MTNAVDEELSRLALMLACSVFIDLARGRGLSGSGRLASRPLRPGSGGDLDIDRTRMNSRSADTG